jgi:hypothetical protein
MGRCGMVLLILGWALITAGQARSQFPAESDSVATSGAGEEAADADLVEALQDLAAADQNLTSHDLAQLNRVLGTESAPVASSLDWRTRWIGRQERGESPQLAGRFSLQGRWFHLRAKQVLRSSDGYGPAGSATLGGERAGLILGQVGLAAGCGLLLASPGRVGGLTADGRWGRIRNRLVGWAGRADEKSLLGMGCHLRTGSLQVQAALGKSSSSQPTFAPETGALSLSWGGAETLTGLSLLRGPTGQGGSLWGKGGIAGLDWAVESRLWSPGGGRLEKAGQVVLGWRPLRRFRLEWGPPWPAGAEVRPRPVGPGSCGARWGAVGVCGPS